MISNVFDNTETSYFSAVQEACVYKPKHPKKRRATPKGATLP
jgi:hypothetical protein